MSESDLLKKLDYYQTFLSEFSEKGTNGGLYDVIIYNYLINLEENVMGILTDNREKIKNTIRNLKEFNRGDEIIQNYNDLNSDILTKIYYRQYLLIGHDGTSGEGWYTIVHKTNRYKDNMYNDNVILRKEAFNNMITIQSTLLSYLLKDYTKIFGIISKRKSKQTSKRKSKQTSKRNSKRNSKQRSKR